MSTAIQYAPRYTVKDYSQWQGNWELWEGIAIAMSPSPFGIHQAVVTQLSRLLGNAVESADCHALPLIELDWVITQDTVVRPDVMVVCGPAPERHCESTPTLVAEVLSDSTRTNDLHFKRQLYQQQGVDVYLMLDFNSRSVEIDRRQADGSYLTEHCQARLKLKLWDHCEIEIDVTKVFRT